MGIRRAAWTPTREGGVPARGLQDRGLQDLLLSAAFIASGPALWWFATLILGDRPEISTLLGQIQDQPGIKAAETLLGLFAAAAGILISSGAMIAVLALLAQQIAHRRDAWTLERALMRWSPGFLRRTVALTLGTGLALTAVGADSWPRLPDTSASQTTASQTPASQTSGATDSVLFDAAEPEATEPDTPERDTAEPHTPERDTAEPDTPEPSPETARPPSGLFTPEAPALNTDRLQGVPQRRGSEPEQVVVRLGDSLWEIAAEHLGSDATDWEIAASWPQWYAANRDKIGDDPGLIHPGTILNAPSP